jgi:hypothetical protein
MCYVQVTVEHRPDAGQRSSRRFTFEEPLGLADEPTARGFAFEALAQDDFRKGLVRVSFPQAASYSFRFERAGLVGYRLDPA